MLECLNVINTNDANTNEVEALRQTINILQKNSKSLESSDTQFSADLSEQQNEFDKRLLEKDESFKLSEQRIRADFEKIKEETELINNEKDKKTLN